MAKQHVDINVPMDEFTIAAIDSLRGSKTRQEFLVLELTKIHKLLWPSAPGRFIQIWPYRP